VSAAQQRDVGRRVVAAEDEGVTVVELEPRPRRAPSALLVDVTAVAAVPFVHRPANGCRYMPREALELVAERRAGRELDLVPARSEGLHECRRLESARTDLRPNGGHSVRTQFRNRPVNSVWTQFESGHRRCGWPDWRAGRRRGVSRRSGSLRISAGASACG